MFNNGFFPEPGNKPMPPVKLHAAWNHGKKVNLTWEWTPLQHNGEPVTTPATFVVNYAIVSNAAIWKFVSFPSKLYGHCIYHHPVAAKAQLFSTVCRHLLLNLGYKTLG